MSKNVVDVYIDGDAAMAVPAALNGETMHSHRPIELVAALDGPAEMRCAGGKTLYSDTFLVPPMRPHALQSYGGRIVRLHVDAGYRSVAPWKRKPILTEFDCKDELMKSLARLFTCDSVSGLAFGTMRSWIGTWIAPFGFDEPSDPRVASVLRHLEDQSACLKVTRNSMARLVGLSPSRFGAIFAKETGASLGRYLIWRRVKIALLLIGQGESVTAAAAAVGFADGAHLTRSCRTTYGFRPSGVINVRISYKGGATELQKVIEHLSPTDQR